MSASHEMPLDGGAQQRLGGAPDTVTVLGVDRIVAFVRDLAAKRCRAGYDSPPWAARDCLGMRESARNEPHRYGDPLLSSLLNGEDICETCRARDLLAEQGLSKDATTRDSAPHSSVNSNVVVAVSDTSRGETK